MRDEVGQGTVEYVIIIAAFSVMLATFGLLWRAIEEGALTGQAVSAASHHVQSASLGNIADVFLY